MLYAMSLWHSAIHIQLGLQLLLLPCEINNRFELWALCLPIPPPSLPPSPPPPPPAVSRNSRKMALLRCENDASTLNVYCIPNRTLAQIDTHKLFRWGNSSSIHFIIQSTGYDAMMKCDLRLQLILHILFIANLLTVRSHKMRSDDIQKCEENHIESTEKKFLNDEKCAAPKYGRRWEATLLKWFRRRRRRREKNPKDFK